MVWALMAVVAAVLVVTTAATVMVLVSRRRRTQQDDTFRCCVRVISGSPAGLRPRWSTAVRHASWAHDVLVLRHGPALVRTCLLPVESAHGPVQERHSGAPWLLGPRVASLTLRLDDGSAVEVSAPASAKALLRGPYLLAALGDSPARAGSRPNDPAP